MSETAGAQRTLAGRYAISEYLGQGGMSTVYRGTDVKLGRQVAIKVMRANLASDEQFRTRFRQEAQAASRLAHPGIVRVLDAGDDLIQTGEGPQRLPFIVMEFVDGKNLRELADEGRLSQAEACRVVDAVLGALEYSHRAGIVHRDIKPANIMITRSGQVKVMDFGIARAVSETSSTVQQTTAILGTAAYFSPEQAKGETVDIRTDLYSTGVLLYELLTGDVPFRGETAVAVAYQHVSERPQPPSERDPEISPALDRVILHSLAKDRTRRFQSASEFREALRLAAEGTMPRLGREEEQSSVLFSNPEDVSESELALRRLSETGASSRAQSRPPVMWIWAAILTVIAVVVAVVFWLVTLAPKSFAPDTSREVPELVDVDRDAALETLSELGLVGVPVEVANEEFGAGRVIRTDPEAGARVATGASVRLFVSTGPESAAVPDFTRMSLEQYTAALNELGLEIGSVTTQDDPSQPAGWVLGVHPTVGTELTRGETVDVVTSTGQVLVPDLINQPLSAAKTLLEGSGLNANPLPDASCAMTPNLTIIRQSIVGQQPQKSTVDIYYCSG
ncbi:MAG: Stk1 family PASTA domain-containing Ser/Thr kinase [Candidatus Leucobacter sulfamidivorax]|nr:Stk1 family PASTA domain-containing Ser/Thr kinase [Candidatus Leucobacter sulfamidivorax]